jgi:hypothetical protein
MAQNGHGVSSGVSSSSGTNFCFIGSGFVPGSEVEIDIHYDREKHYFPKSRQVVDNSGDVRYEFDTKNWSPGKYELTFMGKSERSGSEVTRTIQFYL